MNLSVPKIRSIREQIYEGIKTMVVSGQLPQGARLQENDLAELFQVSRTPVREALKMLKDDGLLDSCSGKGLCVKTLTCKNVEDIFQVRLLLEQFAMQLAIPRLTPEDDRYLLELRARFEYFRTYSNPDEYLRLDSELHDSIIRFSGNQFLRELTDRVYSVLQSVRLFSLSADEQTESSIARHISILDGMLHRDATSTISVLQIHLAEAQRNVLQILEKQSIPT